jgi:hypothetical protein
MQRAGQAHLLIVYSTLRYRHLHFHHYWLGVIFFG